MYKKFIKRFLDILISLILLIVFAIPLIICGMIIKHEEKGSMFFRQKRIGLHKKNFYIYKLRTMRNSTPHNVPTHKFKHPEKYILKCGYWMRKYSIDELPQLINVLKGDMSVVGPRPALWNQYDLIVERDKNGANDIKPGVTGWAQVNGRDKVDIISKAKLDGEYVKRESFIFDVICLLKTFAVVYKHEGVVEGKKCSEISLQKTKQPT